MKKIHSLLFFNLQKVETLSKIRPFGFSEHYDVIMLMLRPQQPLTDCPVLCFCPQPFDTPHGSEGWSVQVVHYHLKRHAPKWVTVNKAVLEDVKKGVVLQDH